MLCVTAAKFIKKLFMAFQQFSWLANLLELMKGQEQSRAFLQLMHILVQTASAPDDVVFIQERRVGRNLLSKGCIETAVTSSNFLHYPRFN